MKPSKTLISAAVAAAIVGAVGFAVAQTSPDPSAAPPTTSSEPMPSTSAAPAAPAPAAPATPSAGSDSMTTPTQDSAPAPELREPKADRN
jgi:hypothetical protein